MIINEEKNYIREFWVKLPTAGLYDILWARWVILSNVWTDLNLT